MNREKIALVRELQQIDRQLGFGMRAARAAKKLREEAAAKEEENDTDDEEEQVARAGTQSKPSRPRRRLQEAKTKSKELRVDRVRKNLAEKKIEKERKRKEEEEKKK